MINCCYFKRASRMSSLNLLQSSIWVSLLWVAELTNAFEIWQEIEKGNEWVGNVGADEKIDIDKYSAVCKYLAANFLDHWSRPTTHNCYAPPSPGYPACLAAKLLHQRVCVWPPRHQRQQCWPWIHWRNPSAKRPKEAVAFPRIRASRWIGEASSNCFAGDVKTQLHLKASLQPQNTMIKWPWDYPEMKIFKVWSFWTNLRCFYLVHLCMHQEMFQVRHDKVQITNWILEGQSQPILQHKFFFGLGFLRTCSQALSLLANQDQSI